MSLPLVAFPFDSDAVRAVVTTRHGGLSTGVYGTLNLGDHVADDPARVRQNRDLVAQALGVDALTVPDQQHGSTCTVVTEQNAGLGHGGAAEAREHFPLTDALVTDLPGIALGIMVADCAPCVLYDPVHRAIGAAHCGRAGLLRGILPSTVRTMQQSYGSDPADLLVGIGPCIGFASYEVGDAEAAALEEVYPGAGFTRPSRPGHQLLDLGGAIEQQLLDLGVAPEHLHRSDVDTLTSTDTYFSDRAARPCGRFMAVVVLT